MLIIDRFRFRSRFRFRFIFDPLDPPVWAQSQRKLSEDKEVYYTMATKWTITEHPVAITRTLSPYSYRGNRRDSILEQNGLHAVAVTHITPRGPDSNQSVALFPTRLVNPQDPRGYLSTPLSFPDVPKPPTRVTYDGVALTFLNDALHQPNYTLSVFVSPDKPVVHTLLSFESPQQLSEASQLSVTVVRQEGGHVVRRIETWLDNRRYQCSLTCTSASASPSPLQDRELRNTFVTQWTYGTKFNCGDPTLEALVYFAKIRTSEAIFNAPTLGLVHSPGGRMFYCGVWCNDQAEYASPVFPILHSPGSLQREAMEQSIRVLTQYFDTATGQIPYSVEIDGGYIGRLDRGDAAMFALGASQYLLAADDPSFSQEFFPAISLACEIICDRIASHPDGILPSQSDELEGRFPTGDANLSVNCLAILALEFASKAAHHLDDTRTSRKYLEMTKNLRNSVHEYFRNFEPWQYDYFHDCPDVRGWICLTALAGLPNGNDALAYALTHLWSSDTGMMGVRTSSESDDVWDRCTLYAIRAAFASGQQPLVELGLSRLEEYSRRRIWTGASAPYAVENETGGAQLAAESALVIRIFTEGLLGLTLHAGRKFSLQVVCPHAWNRFQVDDMWICGMLISVKIAAVRKAGIKDRVLRVTVNMDCGSLSAQLENNKKMFVTLPQNDGVALIEVANCDV